MLVFKVEFKRFKKV